MGNSSSFESNFENVEGGILKLIKEIDTLVEPSTSDKDSIRIKKRVKEYMNQVEVHNKKIRQLFEGEPNGVKKIVDDFAAFKVDTTQVRRFVFGYQAETRESKQLANALREKADRLKDKTNELQHLINKRYPDAAESIDKRIKEIDAAREAKARKLEEDEEDDEED